VPSAALPARSGAGAPLPNPSGQSPHAAVPVSNARAEASRKNGAKSRGPKTPEGKARSAQNALKHGMRAQMYVLLPDENAAEFADLDAALVEELTPVSALQTVLARRVAVAAWRLAHADRLAAGTGLGPRRRTERGRGPIPQPVRRRPTQRPKGRAVRGAPARTRLTRARADPRRQWPGLVRDAAALSRRGNGRVLARAAHPQGAPGGADRNGARRGQATPPGDSRAPPTERTRAPRPAPTRIRPPRPTHVRSRFARARAARTTLSRNQTNPTAAAVLANQPNQESTRTQAAGRAFAPELHRRGRCPHPAHPPMSAPHRIDNGKCPSVPRPL
jgi:hypothetical protein